ncbi:MAG TPA: hypothetical protein DDY39_18415, partial [Nitrospira sp.]|nr:hypothetical protein [Nitrospira sp.]
ATQKVISFAERPLPSLAWRIALGVATHGISEIVRPLASAVLNTSVAKAVLSRLSPERRAIAYLNAVL